jgi:hypothetical protein
LFVFPQIQQFATNKKRINGENYGNKNYQGGIVTLPLNKSKNDVRNYQGENGKADDKKNL